MIKWIKNLIYFNRKMINALNSCKYDEFEFLFNCILAYNGKDFERFFTSKLYIWNVIRPRDFYKMCAMYIHRYTDTDCVIFDTSPPLYPRCFAFRPIFVYRSATSFTSEKL